MLRPLVAPTSRLAVAAALACLLFLPRCPRAQTQPEEASNAQDEYVTINKEVGEETSHFAILRSGDKQEINKYVTKTYRLFHAPPFEVLPYLRSITALERGSVVTASVPAAGEGGLHWVQVNLPEFQVPYVDQLIAAYDVPGFVSTNGDIKFSYRLRHRRASEVADFLRAAVVSPDGDIHADEATNTVYIRDSPSDFERVFSHLQFFDIPVPQVLVELKIVELDELDYARLGLDWDAWKTALGGDITVAYSSLRDAITAGAETSGRSRAFDGLLSLDATVLARFLNYLESEGKARTVITSVLNVSNGQTGVLQSGIQLPSFLYLRDQSTQILTRQDPPPPPPIPTGDGIAVAISPIVAIDTTRLDCEVVIRSAAGVDALGQPVFSDQRLFSNLSVDQGTAYTLGSLRRRTNVRDRKGVPLLKSIPLIRYLFSVETTIARESELFVFVSPTWSAPMIPTGVAVLGVRPATPERILEFLRANPSLEMGPDDRRVLEMYFSERDGG